jgi:hypothetical protein
MVPVVSSGRYGRHWVGWVEEVAEEVRCASGGRRLGLAGGADAEDRGPDLGGTGVEQALQLGPHRLLAADNGGGGRAAA